MRRRKRAAQPNANMALRHMDVSVMQREAGANARALAQLCHVLCETEHGKRIQLATCMIPDGIKFQTLVATRWCRAVDGGGDATECFSLEADDATRILATLHSENLQPPPADDGGKYLFYDCRGDTDETSPEMCAILSEMLGWYPVRDDDDDDDADGGDYDYEEEEEEEEEDGDGDGDSVGDDDDTVQYRHRA